MIDEPQVTCWFTGSAVVCKHNELGHELSQPSRSQLRRLGFAGKHDVANVCTDGNERWVVCPACGAQVATLAF
jgi:hypothetical protein